MDPLRRVAANLHAARESQTPYTVLCRTNKGVNDAAICAMLLGARNIQFHGKSQASRMEEFQLANSMTLVFHQHLLIIMYSFSEEAELLSNLF